jgi:hypothetical protein
LVPMTITYRGTCFDIPLHVDAETYEIKALLVALNCNTCHPRHSTVGRERHGLRSKRRDNYIVFYIKTTIIYGMQ